MIEPARDGRFKATGILNGVGFAVIYRPLGTEGLTVISMRPGARRKGSAMNKGKMPKVSETQIERWRREDEAGMEFTGEVMTFAEAMRRGRPKSANPKTKISLYVDSNALEAFKATGPGWQTRMSEAITAKSRHLAK